MTSYVIKFISRNGNYLIIVILIIFLVIFTPDWKKNTQTDWMDELSQKRIGLDIRSTMATMYGPSQTRRVSCQLSACLKTKKEEGKEKKKDRII